MGLLTFLRRFFHRRDAKTQGRPALSADRRKGFFFDAGFLGQPQTIGILGEIRIRKDGKDPWLLILIHTSISSLRGKVGAQGWERTGRITA
jgi:hypothetical protein